ncbi:sensor histidine kinase [Taibaiella soli]|uniref:Histidine kinase n=1 Tax=Taibaiella soli TaxID=1649169 RepID=A0A2W2AQM5_9BACT|nr:histidine kinase [Taibaiella soli]PZF74720.1 histidine kinase [Taibaiella soli]
MKSKPWLIVVLHVLCWLLYLSLPFMFRPSHNFHHGPGAMPPMPHRDEGFNYLSIATNGLLIPLFYLNLNWLLPKFLTTRKYGAFWVSQLALLGVYFGSVELILWIANPIRHAPFFMQLINYFTVTMVAICYRLLVDNAERERVQKDKETEHLKSELLFLRWQISPHFLFNVLNNLVALARMKSEKMEPMLLQLSTLMRYMLYETDDRKVQLYREAEYLQSYIALQSLRFGNDVKAHVHIDVPEQTVYHIEPMLLIPFVENAFKHGTGLVDNPEIYVEMILKDSLLFFEVKNKYMPRPQDSKDETHGVGLMNVQRRLNLLYEDKYDLNVRIADGWFVSLLKIDLA